MRKLWGFNSELVLPGNPGRNTGVRLRVRWAPPRFLAVTYLFVGVRSTQLSSSGHRSRSGALLRSSDSDDGSGEQARDDQRPTTITPRQGGPRARAQMMSKAVAKRALEVPAPQFLVKRVKGDDSDSVDSAELEDDKQQKITKALRTILEVALSPMRCTYCN